MAVDSKSGYYMEGGIEVIDIVKAKLTPEQYEGFLLGNILKYACRANWKGSFIRDIEKINVYANLLKNYQEEDEIQEDDEEKRRKDAIIKARQAIFEVYQKYMDDTKGAEG